MYAKGSPKYNLAQAAALLKKKGVLGAKKDSPKVTKKSSPKGILVCIFDLFFTTRTVALLY